MKNRWPDVTRCVCVGAGGCNAAAAGGLSDDDDRVLCRAGGPHGTDRRGNDFRARGCDTPGIGIFHVDSFPDVGIGMIGVCHVSDDRVHCGSDW